MNLLSSGAVCRQDVQVDDQNSYFFAARLKRKQSGWDSHDTRSANLGRWQHAYGSRSKHAESGPVYHACATVYHPYNSRFTHRGLRTEGVEVRIDLMLDRKQKY